MWEVKGFERSASRLFPAAPTCPESAIKSSVSIALICTTSRRIPASASANHGPKNGGLVQGRAAPTCHRKVDVRLPGKGARPVHLIITMIKWIRTRRLPIKNSLSPPRPPAPPPFCESGLVRRDHFYGQTSIVNIRPSPQRGEGRDERGAGTGKTAEEKCKSAGGC